VAEHKPCARCGEETPTRDNLADTTHYYGFQMKTETVVWKSVRLIIWSIYGRYAKNPDRILQADEERPLCSDCGGLLIGRFMQGRSVPAIEGKAK
jgi:hypothetical protein